MYFAVITATYLALRRDWRYLISWQYVAGATVFAALVAAWQIPFYLATDGASVRAIWSGLAGDRFHLSGVVSHAVTYPVETFVCLLPWSPILVALAKRETRMLLLPLPKSDSIQPVTSFLLTAILVSYPTVWFAAGARGRYFMPIYPLVAVLVGLVIECCSVAGCGTYPRRAWHQFLLLWGLSIGASALVIGGASLMRNDLAARFYQPRSYGLAYAMLAATAAYLLWNTYRRSHIVRPLCAIVSVALVAGIGATGLIINVNAACWIDPTDAVANLKHQLPPGTCLVSFSPIEHRFAYYYGDSITEIDWPQNVDQLPPGVDYFCFMRQPGDTAKARAAGRGRTWYKTPGTLPFDWQEIMSICVERQVYDDSPRTVVLGRVVRPLRATVSDVTVPQRTSRVGTADQAMQRK